MDEWSKLNFILFGFENKSPLRFSSNNSSTVCTFTGLHFHGKKIKGFDESSSKADNWWCFCCWVWFFFRETTYYFTVKLLFSVFSSNGVSSNDLTIFKIKNLTTRGQLLMLLLVVIRLNLLLLIMSINLVLLLVVMIPISIW